MLKQPKHSPQGGQQWQGKAASLAGFQMAEGKKRLISAKALWLQVQWELRSSSLEKKNITAKICQRIPRSPQELALVSPGQAVPEQALLCAFSLQDPGDAWQRSAGAWQSPHRRDEPQKVSWFCRTCQAGTHSCVVRQAGQVGRDSPCRGRGRCLTSPALCQHCPS